MVWFPTHVDRPTWLKNTEKSYVQVAFEGLEKILTDHPIVKHQRPVFPGPKRLSSSRRIRHLSLISHASDTEHSGDDPIIPATDEVLDNSKTVGNNGIRDAGDWLSFKNEIIKLAHTLRLKGWRRIALNAGDDIRVERLSGALTNAVYVVIPTRDVLKTPSGDSGQLGASKRNPVWVKHRMIWKLGWLGQKALTSNIWTTG